MRTPAPLWIEVPNIFICSELETIKSAQASYVPALFGHGEEDSFIPVSHSKVLHESYAGDKNLILFEGDHNSRRPQFFLDSVSIFIRNYLLSKSEFGSTFLASSSWYRSICISDTLPSPGDNPLPAGESFDDYFSPAFSDDFNELDNIDMLNLLAESFYAKQKDSTLHGDNPHPSLTLKMCDVYQQTVALMHPRMRMKKTNNSAKPFSYPCSPYSLNRQPHSTVLNDSAI